MPLDNCFLLSSINFVILSEIFMTRNAIIEEIKLRKFENFREDFIFAKPRVKIKSSRNAKITQSFTDIGKSCPSREF